MTTCSGIPYESVEQLVETIVSMKKNKYNFPGVDPEDMAQDIRVICWQTLENKFDPNKLGKSVFHFVARVVDNTLYNKFRGVYLDNNPPCIRCEHYVKADKSCAIDELGCDKIVAYRSRMARKRSIAAPLSYDNCDSAPGFSSDSSMSNGPLTGAYDLDATLRDSLDASLIPHYELMLDGKIDQVPMHYRRLVQRQIRLIMQDSEEK